MSDIRAFALSRLMYAAMQNDDEIYCPSEFWKRLNTLHEDHLITGGFDGFKLNANFSYFNFLAIDINDELVQRQISLWPTHFDDTILKSVFENKEALPHGHTAEVHRIYVSLLWGLTNHLDELGLLKKLSEPLVGAPFLIRRDDAYISQDLCNSYREFQAIVTGSYPDRSANGRVIAELGSGYGRVGYVFGMLSDARYCFFDIPPALAIAQTYFERLFPREEIFHFRDFKDFAEIEDELASSRFAFFTANQIAKFPDGYFDTFVNISSLHEMTHKQIRHYLAHFDRLTRTSIYLKQWSVSENDQDKIVVTSRDYPLPSHWKVAMERQDMVNPGFFERLLLRD